MKKILFLAIINCNVFTCFAQLTELWHHDIYKPNTSVYITNEPILVDAIGNSYIVGYHGMSMNGIFFRKYNSDGLLLWNKVFPDSHFILGYNLSYMQFDNNGNILISSHFCQPGQMYLACFDTSGNQLWKKSYMRGNVKLPIYDFVVDNLGNIVISSYTDGILPGDSGLVIIKTNSLGDTLFTSKVDSPSQYWEPYISIDSLYNIIVSVSGYANPISSVFYNMLYKFNALGTLIYADTISIGNIPSCLHYRSKVDNSGNAIVCANGNGWVAQLSKYDNQGNILWTNTNGISGFSPIEIDSSNSIYLTGYLNDYFTVRKLSSQGTIIWTYTYPAANHGFEAASSLQIAKDGSIYVIGNQSYDLPASASIILVHLTKDGQYINSNIRKETNHGTCYADFGLDNYNNVYVIGRRLPQTGFTSYLFTYKLCNSECSSNINGIRFNDDNLDCIYSFTDTKLNQQLLLVEPGSIYATSDSSGNYSLNCDTGNYTIRALLPKYTTVACGPDSINFSISTANPSKTINFGTYTIPNVTDLQLSLGANNTARPGFTNYQNIAFSNIGTISAYNSVVLYKLDAAFSVVNMYPPPDSISGNSYFWNIPSLLLYENKSIFIETIVNTTIPLNYQFKHFASILTAQVDTFPQNNSDTILGFITGSYDPNNKTLNTTIHNPLNPLSPLENEIAYQINFQNTGNDTAFFIQIIDSISNSLDLSTFRAGASSHAFSWTISGPGILKFSFPSILLPDSTTNESRSHGFIKYYIRPKNNLATTAQIRNAAAIYFDFNVAVNTNAVYYPNDLFTGLANTKIQPAKCKLNITPNPANDNLLLSNSLQLKFSKIRISDLQGKIILTENKLDNGSDISVESIENGFYFVECIFEDGSSLINKFIIQH